MLSILERLRRKLFRPVPRRKPLQASRFVKLRLEILEDRTVLDAMLFIGVGVPAAPALWNFLPNWFDVTTSLPAAALPGPADDVGIPGSAGYVSLAPGEGVEINSIVTGVGSILNIPGGSPQAAELKIDSNPPATLPPSFPSNFAPGSNFFGGSVIDAGRMIANTTNPFTGTSVFFAGGAVIGPGDLNGNLDAGPNSSFTFTSTGEFAVGAKLGPGSGSVIIASAVQIDGTLQDNTMTLVLSGGILAGPTATTGALDESATLSWLSGSLALGGGTTIESSGQLLASGPGAKALYGTLTNMSAFSRLDGAGALSLSVAGVGPGTIVNAAGNLEVSLPAITGGFPTSLLTNSPLGTIQATAPASAPTVISAPFTNDGTVEVDSGAALTLSTTGTSSDTLDGVFQLLGNLTLLGAFTSVDGFILQAAPGFMEVGSPTGSTTAILTVPAGVMDTINGNLEVNLFSTLTGAGEIHNAGRLQLDLSSSTAGLGSYVQTSDGTLALAVGGGFGMPAMLAVAGNAQLSGTLILLGYTPTVGASFTVVRAGAIAGHFDTIPDGMEEIDTPTSVTVEQVDPPAGE